VRGGTLPPDGGALGPGSADPHAGHEKEAAVRGSYSVSILVMLGAAAGLLVAAEAFGFPATAATTKLSCASCHTNVAGGDTLSVAGSAYKEKGTVPAAVEGAEYIGTNKCKMCHMPEYKAWLETKHHQAWDALAKIDPKVADEVSAKSKITLNGTADKTDGCVRCHVVGFSLAGGYPQADSLKMANVMNVGCESCHGPGSKHVAAPKAERKRFISRNVGAKMCAQCHTADMSPKFVFEEYKKHGVHVVEAAAK
jgi:hypothetical protein